MLLLPQHPLIQLIIHHEAINELSYQSGLIEGHSTAKEWVKKRQQHSNKSLIAEILIKNMRYDEIFIIIIFISFDEIKKNKDIVVNIWYLAVILKNKVELKENTKSSVGNVLIIP